MTAVTIEQIQAKQTELATLIAQLLAAPVQSTTIEIEEDLAVAVLDQLGGLAHFEQYRKQVKRWDLISLATERRDLMHPNAMAEPWPWLQGIEADVRHIEVKFGMGWVSWSTAFLDRYTRLMYATILGGTTKEAVA